MIYLILKIKIILKSLNTSPNIFTNLSAIPAKSEKLFTDYRYLEYEIVGLAGCS